MGSPRVGSASLVSAFLVVAALVAPPTAAAAPPAAAAGAPALHISEVRQEIRGTPGQVATGAAHCPAGQSVIGGDIFYNFFTDTSLFKAAAPDIATESYVVSMGFGAETTGVVIKAYCVPSSEAIDRVLVQKYYSAASGDTTTGGGASCPADHRLIGGGAHLLDVSTNGTGFVMSNGPYPLGTGWYATARVSGTALGIVAVCLPTASMPPVESVSTTVEADSDTWDFYQKSVTCPPGQRVLTGGASTARPDQFPDPRDGNQGRVAEFGRDGTRWTALVYLNPSYWATIVALCIPDADPPVTTMALPGDTLGSRIALGPKTTVLWHSTDDVEGQVDASQLRSRSAPATGSLGAWQYPAPWSHLSSNYLRADTTAFGTTYCYSARGQDSAGNWSAWAPQRCAVRPLDDRSLASSSGWTRASLPGYWNGTATTTTQKDAVLTRAGLHFDQLALVATKCPTCGRVEVSVDGTRVGVVDLAAASTVHRQVVALPRTVGKVGTVTIKVLTSGKPVTIDGLAVSAT